MGSGFPDRGPDARFTLSGKVGQLDVQNVFQRTFQRNGQHPDIQAVAPACDMPAHGVDRQRIAVERVSRVFHREQGFDILFH